jgi:hypothetical protein
MDRLEIATFQINAEAIRGSFAHHPAQPPDRDLVDFCDCCRRLEVHVHNPVCARAYDQIIGGQLEGGQICLAVWKWFRTSPG